MTIGSGPSWAGFLMVLAGALGMPACVDSMIYYTPINPPPRALVRRPAESVEIFATTPPSRPHTDLGMFEVTGGSDDSGARSLIPHLRIRAGAYGCDGVVITSIDQRMDAHHLPSLKATCIAYNEPDPRDAVAASPVAGAGAAAPAASAPPVAESPWLGAIAAAEVRTAPFMIAPLMPDLAPGQRIEVSRDVKDGWRVARVPGGRRGYIQDADVRLDGAK